MDDLGIPTRSVGMRQVTQIRNGHLGRSVTKSNSYWRMF